MDLTAERNVCPLLPEMEKCVIDQVYLPHVLVPPKEGFSVNPEEVNKNRKLEHADRYEKVSGGVNRYENVSDDMTENDDFAIPKTLGEDLEFAIEHGSPESKKTWDRYNLPRRNRCSKCGLMMDSSQENCPLCGVVVSPKQSETLTINDVYIGNGVTLEDLDIGSQDNSLPRTKNKKQSLCWCCSWANPTTGATCGSQTNDKKNCLGYNHKY